MTKKKFVIIVAGGSGLRMGADLPKQFLKISNLPILMHTLLQFKNYDEATKIILVLPNSQIEFWKELCNQHHFTSPHTIVKGGQTRYHSVQNGLNSIKDTQGLVAIHDGVRMFISTQEIQNTFDSALLNGSGVLSTSSKDSLRVITDGENKGVDRSKYRIIQTPQTFDLSLIKEAFKLPYQSTFTDDASVFENAGHKISLVEGTYKNIKITTPEDLIIADAFLKNNNT